MFDKKTLLIAVIAILLGFALGRCELCLNCGKGNLMSQGGAVPMSQPGGQQGMRANPGQPVQPGSAPMMAPGSASVRNGDDSQVQQAGAETRNAIETAPASGKTDGKIPSGGNPQTQMQPSENVIQAEALAAVIKAATPALKSCYDVALKSTPELGPNFELQVFLTASGGSGKLSGLKSLSPLPLSNEALNCFIVEISKLQFDLSLSHEGDESSVVTALDFGSPQP